MTNMSTPRVAVVIPTHKRSGKLSLCLESLARSRYREHVVIVVNDGGCPETSRVLRVEIASAMDLWWSRSMNEGIEKARELGAKYCLVLNDDVTVDPDALPRLVQVAEAEAPAIVCSVIADSRDHARVWAAGGGLSWPLPGEYHHTNARQVPGSRRDVDWSPGMGTLVPLSAFDRLGLYDHLNMPQYLADADLCLRARKAGIRVVLCEDSYVYNDTSTTGGIGPTGPITWKQALDVVLGIRGPDFIQARAVFTWRHCPKALVVPALALRYGRLGGHLLRRLIQRNSGAT
jgi:GT2 family glycosyltransferase